MNIGLQKKLFKRYLTALQLEDKTNTNYLKKPLLDFINDFCNGFLVSHVYKLIKDDIWYLILFDNDDMLENWLMLYRIIIRK